MKKLVIVAMALVVAGSSLAWGQDTAAKVKKGSIYAGLGMSMPMSPDFFSDNYGSGFSFGGGLGYKFTPMIEGVALLDYTSFSADGGGSDLTTMDIMGLVKFIFGTANTASKLKPYLQVGIGMTSIDGGGGSESDMALAGGGGLEIWVNPKFAIFGDVKYVTVSADPESVAYIPIRAGVKIPVF